MLEDLRKQEKQYQSRIIQNVNVYHGDYKHYEYLDNKNNIFILHVIKPVYSEYDARIIAAINQTNLKNNQDDTPARRTLFSTDRHNTCTVASLSELWGT